MKPSPNYWLLPIAILLLWSGPASSRSASLDEWVSGTLIPEVHTALATHARFRGETVRFVVLSNGAPAAVSNVLAMSLRDRLLESAVASGRIHVASETNHSVPGQAIDCTQDDADYLVGVEVTNGLGSSASVVVRAMDLRENTWVNGFAVGWRGTLDKAERRALATGQADPALRGARNAPYSASESDLLASRLSRDISCQLLKGPASDYVVAAADITSSEDDALWRKTLDLSRQYLTSHAAVELTSDVSRATAELTATAHDLGGGLYQVWLTVLPAAGEVDLDTLSASAYVRLASARPDVAVAATHGVSPAPAPQLSPVVALPGGREAVLLGPLKLSNRHDGSVLETTARTDSILFFIQYQPGKGMVRLGDRNCRPRTIARLARAGENVTFPVPERRDGTVGTEEIPEWHALPARNTYFAIAVGDSKLARQVATLFDDLPMRCGSRHPGGLDDDALFDWLDELAALANSRERDVSWRAVQTRDVL